MSSKGIRGPVSIGTVDVRAKQERREASDNNNHKEIELELEIELVRHPLLRG